MDTNIHRPSDSTLLQDSIRITTRTLQKAKELCPNLIFSDHNRAAKVLVAMAEAYAANNDNQKAASMLKKYYYELFNRYSAFRSEVRELLDMSEILRKKSNRQRYKRYHRIIILTFIR